MTCHRAERASGALQTRRALPRWRSSPKPGSRSEAAEGISPRRQAPSRPSQGAPHERATPLQSRLTLFPSDGRCTYSRSPSPVSGGIPPRGRIHLRRQSISPAAVKVLSRTVVRWTKQQCAHSIKDWRANVVSTIYNKGPIETHAYYYHIWTYNPRFCSLESTIKA